MKPQLPLIIGGVANNIKKSAGRYHPDIQRTGLAVAAVVILSVLLSIHLLPSKVSLKLGDVSQENITARKFARYKDTAETELRKSQAALSVGKAYDPVPNAADQSIRALKTILNSLENIRSSRKAVSTKQKVRELRTTLGASLGSRVTDTTFAVLLNIEQEKLREVEDDALRIVSEYMGTEIKEDPADLRMVYSSIAAKSKSLAADPKIADTIKQLAQDCIQPNQIYNEERTLDLQEKARDSVQPVYRQIKPGELLIAKGEKVLREHIEKFEALGLRHPKIEYRTVLSLTLFVILAVSLVAVYMCRYFPTIYYNTKSLFLLTLIVCFITLALRISGSLLGIPLNQAQVGYFGILWVVTAGMIISVLLNKELAYIVVTLMSIVLSLTLNGEIRVAASAILTSYVGIYSVDNIRDRHDLWRAMAILAATGVVLIWILGGFGNDSIPQMLTGTVWAVVNGVLAGCFFWIGTWILERPFDTITHMSLLELADTNRQLLRRLVIEAPGTYTHSVAVGHLAETGAEAIGADSLLTRVASYYHDIGKLRRPHFFTENQNVENVHDNMNPTLSALVITSHIKDGYDIAKEAKLPKVVLDVIIQHHGVSLVQYFYNQAAGEQDPSTALEQQFRYAGPKPQTKEAAIVMLADSVEAASRSLDKPTHAKIELLVNRVVADKLRDGQLDESELTFRDISKIIDCFVRVIVSTMHARIEYPDPVCPELKKSNNTNADTDNEQPETPSQENKDQESCAPGS